MKHLLSKLLSRAGDFSDVQPLPALFLGGALLAVFLTAMRTRRSEPAGAHSSLIWTLYRESGVLLWAFFLVSCLAGGISILRSYLHQTVANFERNHGRVTQANYNAVQTIWGPEQTQGELKMNLYWNEEVTDRIEFEDVTKPAVLRKKTVRHDITANPFVSARHSITLTQAPRKKGSALYRGYDTKCAFTWRLKNPTDRALTADLSFPLPGNRAMYDDMSAIVNGEDILSQMQFKDSSLVLSRDLKPGEVLDLSIGFKSRGMSYWYLQIQEPREIRDFTLLLTLPDMGTNHINYPEGCMTPTEIKTTPDGQGSVLTYRLDHAMSSKGMGIALPTLPQPGATTSAVLGETEQGWLLIFALLMLGSSMLTGGRAVLFSLLFGSATALGYGLLGDFSDLLFGFWGTAAVILLPMFGLLAFGMRKMLPGTNGKLMALQLLLYGIALPCLAGLDETRESLYLDICAVSLVAFIAWQIARQWNPTPPIQQPAVNVT